MKKLARLVVSVKNNRFNIKQVGSIKLQEYLNQGSDMTINNKYRMSAAPLLELVEDLSQATSRHQ